MPLELCEDIFVKLASSNSTFQALLSGGEPTLHPNFEDICSLAYRYFEKTIINTNGLNLHKIKRIKRFNDKISIQISIDGDEKFHESIRGLNTYHKTLSNIEAITELGFKVTIATTVSNKNITSLKSLDDDLESLAFYQWNLKRIVGYGRANDEEDISTQDWNMLVDSVYAGFCNASRASIRPMFSLRNIATSEFSSSTNEELSNIGTNCGTGRSKMYVNPDGTVYPCACMEENIVGDFHSDSYTRVAHALSNIDILPSKYSICYQCRAFSQCKGGCPGIGGRNLSQGDPRCLIVNKVLLTKG